MSERISDTNNGTANSEARTPRFNRSKTVQVIISILVALALWVYVDVEKRAGEDEDHPDVPVEFSGENTTLADKNLMLLSGYDTTIDLTIRGPKRELVKMSRDNVRVIASTSSIDPVGVHQLDWTVSFPDGVVRTNVSVEKRQPEPDHGDGGRVVYEAKCRWSVRSSARWLRDILPAM